MNNLIGLPAIFKTKFIQAFFQVSADSFISAQ